jgi:cytochrome P450
MSSSVQNPGHEIFDPFVPLHLQEPFPFFARLREAQPVYWNAQYSFWMLTRYQDVKWALQSPAKFSSATGGEIARRSEHLPQDTRASFDICSRFWYTAIQATDAPRHAHQRHPLMKALTPALIAQMQGAISQRVERLLDGLQQAGTVDFVAQFAYPLPSLVIFDLLGLPPEHHQIIHQSAAGIVKFPTAALRGDFSQVAQIAEHLKRAEVVLKELILKRRAAPMEDLISTLVNEDGTGSRLSDDEIVVLCNFLLTAGHETTANLLAGSMRFLLSERQLWDQLREHPELLGDAIEELLRFISPVLWVTRVVTEDVELAGQVLPKGSRVLLGTGAANHDPAEFRDPETLDLTRAKPHSLAFGYGPHFCIGAALARLETQVALLGLMRRTPNITLESKTFDYRPIHFLRALKTLQVSL